MKVIVTSDGLLVLSKSEIAMLNGIGEVKPNFSKMSRELKTPVTTLWDNWQRLHKNNELQVTILVKAKPVQVTKPQKVQAPKKKWRLI